MSSICDAARLGKQTIGTIMYTTTFPCHMCAKHIVAAGIDEVIFLEPYPKSLAKELHSDSIEIDGQSRGKYSGFRATKFKQFWGVTPRRYRELFERAKRKGADGELVKWRCDPQVPIIDVMSPIYLELELRVLRSNGLSPWLRRTPYLDVSLDVGRG